MDFINQFQKLLGRKPPPQPQGAFLPGEFLRSNLDGLLACGDLDAANKARDIWLQRLGSSAGAWSEAMPQLPLLEINRLPSFASLKKTFYQLFVTDELKQRWWSKPPSETHRHPALARVASSVRAGVIVIRSRLDDSGQAAELVHALEPYLLMMQEQLGTGAFHPAAGSIESLLAAEQGLTSDIRTSVAATRALLDLYAETKKKSLLTGLEKIQGWARTQQWSTNWIANSSLASMVGEIGSLQRDTRTVSESVEQWRSSVLLGQITTEERKGCWFGLQPYTPQQQYQLLGDALALLSAAGKVNIPPARLDPLLVSIISGFQPLVSLLKSHGAGYIDDAFPVFYNALRLLPRHLLNQMESSEMSHIIAAQLLQVATTATAATLSPSTFALILEDFTLERRLEGLVKN